MTSDDYWSLSEAEVAPFVTPHSNYSSFFLYPLCTPFLLVLGLSLFQNHYCHIFYVDLS